MKKRPVVTLMMAVGAGALLLFSVTGIYTYAGNQKNDQGARFSEKDLREQPETQQSRPLQQDPQRFNEQLAFQPAPEKQQQKKVNTKTAWQEHRAKNWRDEHRTWQDRGGYNGFRIPPGHFQAYFGRDHRFRMYRQSFDYVNGHPRFHYGDFWFSVVDPWPEYWADNWYENDDVHIAYADDGYYLFNNRHPRDRIAINVTIDIH